MPRHMAHHWLCQPPLLGQQQLRWQVQENPQVQPARTGSRCCLQQGKPLAPSRPGMHSARPRTPPAAESQVVTNAAVTCTLSAGNIAVRWHDQHPGHMRLPLPRQYVVHFWGADDITRHCGGAGLLSFTALNQIYPATCPEDHRAPPAVRQLTLADAQRAPAAAMSAAEFGAMEARAEDACKASSIRRWVSFLCLSICCPDSVKQGSLWHISPGYHLVLLRYRWHWQWQGQWLEWQHAQPACREAMAVSLPQLPADTYTCDR